MNSEAVSNARFGVMSEKSVGWQRAKDVVMFILFVGIVVTLIVLVFSIVTADTSLKLIPTDSESAAVIRANERTVQLTQWAISTVLVVAGGLIGLNWYQNDKRYERDRAEVHGLVEHSTIQLESKCDRLEHDLATARLAQEDLESKLRSLSSVTVRLSTNSALSSIQKSAFQGDAGGALFYSVIGYFDLERWMDDESLRNYLSSAFLWIDQAKKKGGSDKIQFQGDFQRDMVSRFMADVKNRFPRFEVFLESMTEAIDPPIGVSVPAE